MYLNDDDVIAVLKTINQITEPNGQICFIESMSDKERLTLKDIYSEELKQNYSAIYRSVDEFISMMEEMPAWFFLLRLEPPTLPVLGRRSTCKFS